MVFCINLRLQWSHYKLSHNKTKVSFWNFSEGQGSGNQAHCYGYIKSSGLLNFCTELTRPNSSRSFHNVMVFWQASIQSDGKCTYWCALLTPILHTVQETLHLCPSQWWIQFITTCFYTYYTTPTELKNKSKQPNKKQPPPLRVNPVPRIKNDVLIFPALEPRPLKQKRQKIGDSSLTE